MSLLRDRSGFTYMGMLAVILIIGISSSVLGQSWRLFSRVEKEKELLWRGHQFRLAIKKYYLYHQKKFQNQAVASSGQVVTQFYPTSFDDLLKDPTTSDTVRHLRRVYTDPMTGNADWVPVPVGSSNQSGETQGVSGQAFWGVRSNSDAEPLKKDNFDLDDYTFKGKTQYSQWEFVYNPNAPAPGSTVTIPTGANNPSGNNGSSF